MKKRISLLIILSLLAVIVLVFSACGETPQVTDTGANTNTDTGDSSDTNTETPDETVKEFTVTFVQKGFDNIVKTVKEGEALTDIPTPQNETGYIVEWEKFDLSNITNNIVVNAIKTPIKYTVTFSQGDSHPDVQITVNYGEGISNLPTPKDVEGYIVEWESVDLSNIISDIVVSAIKTPREYTVTFIQDGFVDVIRTVKYGEAITDIPTPRELKGYTFEWENVDLTFISSNLTVYAIKKPIEYNINYILNGGTNNPLNAEKFTIEDGVVKLYTPTNENGVDFLGWYTTETFDVGTRIDKISDFQYKDVTLYACWANSFIEIYNGFSLDESGSMPKLTKIVSNSTENIDLNRAFTVSTGCTWKLYEDFIGENEYKLKAMSLDIGKNKSYIIVYHPDGEHWTRYELEIYRLDIKEYCFVNDENEMLKGNIEEQSILDAPQSPEKRGYTFDGWTVDGKLVSFPYQVNVSTIFTAQYSIINYNIAYELNGGTNGANPSVYTVEQKVNLINPTKTGYTFAGWYSESTFENQVSSIANGTIGDKTFYAKWIPTNYEITYVLNNGTNGKNPSTYTVEQEIVLQEPKRNGCIFNGWYGDSSFKNQVSNIAIGTIGNKTLYAKWELINYDIIYELNGGTNGENPNTYTVEQQITLKNPSRPGYTFVGWYSESSFVNKVTSITKGETGVKTLYAQWKPNNNIVSFNANGGYGTMPNITIATDASTLLPSNTFTRTGYTFKGWATSASGEVVYEDGTSYTMGTNSKYTLYAIWELNVYKIVCEVSEMSGHVVNTNVPTSYTINDTIKLVPPELDSEYYDFIGWFTDENFENPISEINKNTGDLSLYAKWVTNDNALTFSKKTNGYYITNCVSDIDVVIIPKTYSGLSVISIDFYAFSYCKSLTSVTIPDSVTRIGYEAFYNCDSLTSIVIPDSVTSIGSNAFYNCSNLTGIEIPDSVTSIGDNAFYNCSSLTSVTIGNSVTSIGSSAFYGCSSLTSVNYLGTIEQWCNISFGSSSSNPLYNGAKLYFNGELVTELVIPDSVTSIGNYAFYNCSSLTSIVIPDSVTSIGDYAFRYCSSLTSIVIPDSVTSIGDSAFYNCSSLTSVAIPDSVTSIRSYTFYNCSSLTSVTIGNSVTSIGSSAFSGCSSLTSVTIGNSVTSIGWNAFYGCSSLTSVNYLGAIEQWCNIPFEYSDANPLCYGANLYFNGELVTELVVPNTVTKINKYAFYNCSSLTSVTIGNSVTSIGDNAFYNCSNLTSVTIGDSVTSIGDNAFYNCSNLTGIEIPDSVISIGEKTFYNCSSLTSVVIPDRVTSIGESAFSGCSKLKSITIPFVGCSANATTASRSTLFGYIFGTSSYTGGVGTKQYYGSSYSTYYIPSTLKNVTVTGGNIPYGAFYNCSSLTSIVIPDSATSIGDRAFYNCNSLTSVTIPDSVTIIGDGTFEDCSSLTSITIPDSVTSIGDNAFYKCSSLTSITIPDSVTSIGDNAFYKCSSLKSIVIPDSVTSMGKCAFYNCGKLASVTIGDSVTSIGGSAFRYCSSLTSIVISDSVTSIGDFAFEDCSSLTSITIPDSVTIIGDGTFEDCSSLTSVTIGNSVTSIGEEAFYNCSNLTSVTIGDSVTSIGDYAFSSCSSLASVNYLGTMEQWCDISFGSSSSNPLYNGTKLYFNGELVTELVIPNTVTKINEYAFRNCSSITSVTIGDSVTSIGSSAFSYCDSLTSVTIGDSVTSIGSSAFNGCGSLTSIVIPDSVTSIGSYAFENCSSLTIYCVATSKPSGWSSYWNYSNRPVVWDSCIAYEEIGGIIYGIKTNTAIVAEQPENIAEANILSTIIYKDTVYPVISIGNSAFYNCSSLTSVVIPDSVTSIGGDAFYNCSNLTSVTIGDSVTSIGNYAFKNCSNLTGIEIPDSVTSIGGYAFYNCSNLTWIIIPDSVTSIGSCAFQNCDGLTIYCVAEGESSGWNSRWNCSSCPIVWGFTYSEINGIVYAIDNGVATVVRQSSNIEEANILSAITFNGIEYPVTSIESDAFNNCYDLTSVTIGNSVISIGSSAFSGCSSLTSVAIGNSVTSIGDYAFSGCSSMTSIELPDSVTSMGDSAFSGCRNLTSIVIPDSVTSIGSYAFQYCSSLTSIVIPDSVTSIGSHAFRYCNSLTSIVIPDSVTSIGNSAFNCCDSLTIYCEATSEPSGWNSNWNPSNRPVAWGHTHSYTDGKCICGVKQN